MRSAAGTLTALPSGPGVAAPIWPNPEDVAPIGPIWYYTYGFEGAPVPGHQRVYVAGPAYDERALAAALTAHPGSWWMVGNEPNDPAQDDLSPGAYAAHYRRFLASVERAGARVRVMPAGIANADWGWAEDWREGYRYQYGKYPHVDAWNIHNYILGPEADPCDVVEFQRRIVTFRDWMAAAGEGRKPLVLSEFGVLRQGGVADRRIDDCAPAYMRATVAWLSSTQHVQAWAWFSLTTSGRYAGDLLDGHGALTPLGLAYAEFAGGRAR